MQEMIECSTGKFTHTRLHRRLVEKTCFGIQKYGPPVRMKPNIFEYETQYCWPDLESAGQHIPEDGLGADQGRGVSGWLSLPSSAAATARQSSSCASRSRWRPLIAWHDRRTRPSPEAVGGCGAGRAWQAAGITAGRPACVAVMLRPGQPASRCPAVPQAAAGRFLQQGR